MVWFLIGLILFGLFSGAVTAALTVVVVNGGPNAAASEKLSNVSIIPLQERGRERSGMEGELFVKYIISEYFSVFWILLYYTWQLSKGNLQ